MNLFPDFKQPLGPNRLVTLSRKERRPVLGGRANSIARKCKGSYREQ